MKKTILGSASIFALALTAPAMAQSVGEPTPPATPTTAPATTDCPAGTNNCSLVEQDGTDLVVEVDQTGSGNVSDVDQVNGATGNGTTVGVDVDQTGDDNQSYVLQDDTLNSTVQILQDGVGAESSVIQLDAQGHKVSVAQTGANDSFVFQEGPDFGGDSRIEIVQFGGDGNTSVAFQQSVSDGRIGQPGGLANGVTQNGNMNNSEVYQGDFVGTDNANRLSAEVNQTGTLNDSFISQSNTDAVNQTFPFANTRVRVTQFGIENESSIVQSGARGGQQTGFNVDVNQDGNNNLSRVVQNNQSSANALASTISVDQDGNENDSFVDQSSGSGFVQVEQVGNPAGGSIMVDDRFDGGSETVRATFSNVVQSGAERTETVVFQQGAFTRSDIRQINSSAAGAAIANVQQTGIGNNSDISQIGDHSATVRQGDPATPGVLGAFEDSLIEQAGDNQTAIVDQFGQDNFSSILQLAGGGDNTAQVTQTGVLDASFVTQSGFGNTATVNQGPGVP